jgi:NADH-quinone oxidoreductase subunit M
MLAFLAAFAVKLPAVPVHTWLPDAHTQAPVAGSVVLAGLVLKLGAYGLIRFLVPLFPAQAMALAPVGMVLAVVGILYGGLVAFGQRDMKRYVAYTSLSHMGFVLLAVCAWNDLALQGAVVILIAHALGTGALFILVGMADERLRTRELADLGGLWAALPRMGGATMFFAVAALGLPGLAGFVGEFLVLLGTWPVSPFFAVVAAGGLVVSVIYALRFVQEIFLGRPGRRQPKEGDMTAREWVMMGALIAGTVWIGLFPQGVLDTSFPAVTALRQQAEANGAHRPKSFKPAPRGPQGTQGQTHTTAGGAP